jgi:hypothetical protein
MSRLLPAALAALLLALPACGGGNGAAPGGVTDPGDPEVMPGETGPPPPIGLGEDEVELSIEDQDTNDILGTALFRPEGETSTLVSIFLDVIEGSGGQAEIRAGRCEEADAEVTHELGPLEEGFLETVVDTPLDELMATPHALWTQSGEGGPRGCSLIAPYGVDLD